MSWLLYRWLAVFGVSSFMFKGCQSLFLRHIETGKCIAAADELVYFAPSYSLPYFVKMTDNCLDNKAEFRYLDSQLLHNIEKNGTLVSSSAEDYMNRWAVYKGVATDAKHYQQRVEHRLKQTATGSLLFYSIDRVCAEPDSSNYLLRKTYCNKTRQRFTFGSITPYNSKMENVHCSPIQRMMVNSADYGRFNNRDTFNNNATIDTQCSKVTNCQVKSLCGGQRSCQLTMDNNLLPSQYCCDTSKQIYTKYTCVDTYRSSAITAAPNIRLTKRHAGFIEIKNGSIWRRVVEENWDENRQKMLCQHLGFEVINGNRIKTAQLGSGQQIITGDLICYNTQPNGTSCCVHLKPSTSTTSTTIPYVTCKMCKNPLLHNTAAFPDSVFSGSGDSSVKYKDARITEGGWCPSSGSAYLLLDLQKEYHITQAVIMADKEQTKWSSSYTLKYSHNTSFENIAQIMGNQNGYQASRTNLDIYNVRYVKIESTGNQDFCLRIELCGEDIDECTVGAHNCHVHATCMRTNGSFVCACNPGWSGNGVNCTDIDECTVGTDNCHAQATCTNTNGSFVCACNPGWSGNRVNWIDIDECTVGTDNCHAQASCTNTNGSFVCACNPDWSGNGVNCTDIDECTVGAHNCHAQATCTNTNGSFVCACNSGWSGNGVYCTDIDECTEGTDNCHPQATCTNTNGSFVCACNPGWSGNGVNCTDIEECTVGTDNCHAQATCTNTNGSFVCACNPGWSGNGVNCNDIDECTEGTRNCHAQATCINTNGSFVCACNPDWSGNGVNCTDINECTVGTDNCHAQASCTNTNGSFVCACNPGWSGNGVNCTDIMECTEGYHDCHQNATCNNNIGSFSCSCNSGFTGNGTYCEDINECTEGFYDCHQNSTCKNDVGSFSCSCNSGFSGNRTYCEDINECTEESENCHQNATCNNNVGSFSCSCNSGFSGNGTYCEDIDECTEGTDNCHAGATCTNTNGSFLCACNPGWSGNGVNCTDINECDEEIDNNCHAEATCTNNMGSFTCACNSGWSGDGATCNDIDECATGQCTGSDKTCTNFPGSYRCICKSPGKRLSEDGSKCVDVAASLRGQFVILNGVFVPEYNDKTSLEYHEIMQEIIEQLKRHLQLALKLRSIGPSVLIIGLSPGSIVVDFLVSFDNKNGVDRSIVRNELFSTLNSTNGGIFLGDFQLSESSNANASVFSITGYDECNPADDVHTVDCGNNEKCVNTDLSYDCVCETGYKSKGRGCVGV